MFARRRIKICDHFRKVFSLTPTSPALNDSMQYRFNSISAHNKCSGVESLGRTVNNMSQTATQTIGFVPKKSRNLRYPRLMLPSWASCPVILCPILQNISVDNIFYLRKLCVMNNINNSGFTCRLQFLFACCLILRKHISRLWDLIQYFFKNEKINLFSSFCFNSSVSISTR